jgi:hypothetical protein
MLLSWVKIISEAENIKDKLRHIQVLFFQSSNLHFTKGMCFSFTFLLLTQYKCMCRAGDVAQW